MAAQDRQVAGKTGIEITGPEPWPVGFSGGPPRSSAIPVRILIAPQPRARTTPARASRNFADAGKSWSGPVTPPLSKPQCEIEEISHGRQPDPDPGRDHVTDLAGGRDRVRPAGLCGQTDTRTRPRLATPPRLREHCNRCA